MIFDTRDQYSISKKDLNLSKSTKILQWTTLFERKVLKRTRNVNIVVKDCFMSMIYTFRLKRNVFYIHELLFVQQRLVLNKFKFMYFYFRFLINASIKQMITKTCQFVRYCGFIKMG